MAKKSKSQQSRFAKARYHSSVIALQVVALLFGVYAFRPWLLPTAPPPVVLAVEQPKPPPKRTVVSGVPARIVFPSLELDLPIDEGLYDDTDQTWTLSGLRAQFATISQPANDFTGSTFIYGHNNKHVFGRLSDLKPGDRVRVYTANGQLFTYVYESAHNTKPDDVSALSYQGPPILTVQTCIGSFNEWRRMYRFRFETVKEA